MSGGHGHFRHVCKHGRVVAQCRCPNPSKTETVVDRCPDDCDGTIYFPRPRNVFAYYHPDKQHLNSPEAYEDYDDTP